MCIIFLMQMLKSLTTRCSALPSPPSNSLPEDPHLFLRLARASRPVRSHFIFLCFGCLSITIPFNRALFPPVIPMQLTPSFHSFARNVALPNLLPRSEEHTSELQSHLN